MIRSHTSRLFISPSHLVALLSVIAIGALQLDARGAEEAFYRIPLLHLKLVNGQWPQPNGPDRLDTENWSRVQAMEPWVRMENGAEAYVVPHEHRWDGVQWSEEGAKKFDIVIRSAADASISGLIVVPTAKFDAMVPLRFTAERPAKPDPAARDRFYRTKQDHYSQLQNRQLPGSAWFRYQARDANSKLSKAATRELNPEGIFGGNGQFFDNSLDESYGLFSGGRALSENLQLDRVIPAGRRVQEPSVAFDKIEGIKTKEMDWQPLIKGMQPAADPLAAAIPVDQHAVFFPSFAAMRSLVEEADTQGVPVLQALEPQASDARVKERYQRQLCLPFTIFGKLLGPQLIDSVAITGSDPYLRVGADVAVLFAAKDAGTLKAALAAQMNMAQQREAGAQAVEGKVGNVAYTGVRSPDRAVCAYLAQLGNSNTIVVTNSLKQLDRLIAVQEGKSKAITAAPEYTFFRDRYKRGGDESAFVVLTDATIRRWCSARWRILDSRRTLAAAVMSDLQAQNMNALSTAKIEAAPITSDRKVTDIGELRLTSAGVTSTTYGSLDFMTPIVELTSDKATEDESQMYGRWRQGYESNWSNYFDPIAIRLSVTSGKIAADVTVMPLIEQSKYNYLAGLSNGATLAQGSGDPHDALLHFAMAINHESPPMKEAAEFLRGQAPKALADPLAWVGKTAAIYVDDDPLWQEAAKEKDPEKYLQEHFDRLPIAIYIANASPLRLAAFITAARTYINTSAPDSTVWETLQHNDMSYVRISGKGERDLEKIKVYYATTPEALVVTLNESVLKRALDRIAARQQAKAAGNGPGNGAAPAAPATQPAKAPMPWLGESTALQIDGKAIAAIRAIFGRSYQKRMQELSWNNLPILNEWKRLYPNEDPVKLHQRLWQVRLVDPAGGQYVWNEQYQTMESTTYGHPGAPKEGPGLPPQLDQVTRVGLGVTFENKGLRARAEIEREAGRK